MIKLRRKFSAEDRLLIVREADPEGCSETKRNESVRLPHPYLTIVAENIIPVGLMGCEASIDR